MVKIAFSLSGTLVALALSAGVANADSHMSPFGSPEDVAYAGKVWERMAEERLRGPRAINTIPYEGIEPHGAILETLIATMEVDGHEGVIFVKRNYGPAGVAKGEVQKNRSAHLGAVTVMFQREDGYDADHDNWFWAKFKPDGALDVNPQGVPLAGRVAKGQDTGCIACHQNAPGEDYLFTTD